jgi:5'-AMP-activated protein kinase, catalytic alpha subunit
MYVTGIHTLFRDLKPENLLICEDKLLKIIDFGLSNTYSDEELLKTPCGSPCYAAPEMLKGKKYNGLQIDIWSTGIILYAMINGFLPFEDENNTILYKKIIECNLQFPYKINELALDMILRILTVNPNKRITLEEIKEHEFYLLGMDILAKKKKKIDATKVKALTVTMMKEMGVKENELLKLLEKNEHNNTTATYYILHKKLMNEEKKLNPDKVVLNNHQKSNSN